MSIVCLECDATVDLTKKDMEDHVTSVHNLSLVEYERRNKDGLEEQFTELARARNESVSDNEAEDAERVQIKTEVEDSSTASEAVAAEDSNEEEIEISDFEDN